MALDARIRDLIHRQIDGCLSARERSELQEFLASDPGARHELMQMERTASLLEQAGAIEPPGDLRAGVLQAVRRAPPPRGAVPPRWMQGWRPAWPGALRYGYGFAAGLGVGLLAYAWSVDRLVGPHPAEPGAVTGTMVPRGPAPEGAAFEQVPIALGSYRGTATVSRTGTGLSLSLEADAAEALTVALGFDHSALALESLARSSAGIVDLKVTGDEIRWTQRGEGVVAARLAGAGRETAAEVELRVYSGGQTVHRLRLAPPSDG